MEGKGDVYLSMLYVGDLLTVAVMIFEAIFQYIFLTLTARHLPFFCNLLSSPSQVNHTFKQQSKFLD